MYRNISYNGRDQEIIMWTWDESGNRVTQNFPFCPYLYLEQKDGATARSIFDTPLVKREFENDYKRKMFVKNAGMSRVFYNLPPEQQFLIDRYHGVEDWSAFTRHPLRTFYIDLECYSPDEFPKASEAKHPINLITIYDTLDETFYTWGLNKSYSTPQTNVKYTQCIGEQDLLKSFLRHWRKNFPDIVSGYNSDGFDLPYIVNRLNLLFGEDYAKRLSPTDNIWSNEKLDRYKNPVTEWFIAGISCIDYMKAYQKFAINQRESYTLDYIANYELGYGKDDLDGMSIAEFSEANWQLFVDYNIKDVQLLIDLEKKLHYLELCRMIGYKGLTKFEKALGTTTVAAGVFALEAMKRDQIIPTFRFNKGYKPPGGTVHEPVPGFNENVITFDAKSLYPNTIITLNISPETKLGNITTDGNTVTITTVRGKEFTLTVESFEKWMHKEKICKSMNNILFSQSKKGIIPTIIDNIYADRKKSQALCKKLDKKMSIIHKSSHEYAELKKQSEEHDVMQYTLKILMNSIYGTFGNEHSIMYDPDIASSITLAGQESNHKACEAVRKYVLEKYNISDNIILYGHTDSIFITLTPILNKLGIKLQGVNGNIHPQAAQVIEELGGEEEAHKGYISKHLRAWAKKDLGSIDPRFEFSREKISDVILFFERKNRYISHNLNIKFITINPGDKKEWSYTGVEVVSASMAKEIKIIIKNAIQRMILDKDPNIGNTLIKDIYTEFCDLNPEILATRKAIRDLKKYEKISSGFIIGKGAPQNSKASLYHNALINHLKLNKKYEMIKSGDKIKMLYVAKNKFGIKCIAFKDKLPAEFEMSPDYDMLFLKTVQPIFQRLYDAVGWQITNPTKNYSCDLMSVFG